ncbi:hypothetical protein E2562_021494 [Oryza meyeriana var. granulata]|uniref:DUF1618 domain-containing protein n=1 Tax=Oryza meyeriana var. granulata TaxID=110450 RepID=A0A6G1DY71_9ORYZ|nr:hypothetical protein E2562_021494 [Oryza meyeriana var. granulata]
MYRTMGKSGDSIKFVSINSACTAAAAGQATEGPWHSTTAAGKATVAVWTLDQAGLGWKKDVEFSLKSLWAKRGFKASRLPKEVPVWPFLRPQEDGALYFLVPKPLMKPEDPQLYHICGVDMRSKKILLSGLLSDHSLITQPVTLPANAFAFQHL